MSDLIEPEPIEEKPAKRPAHAKDSTLKEMAKDIFAGIIKTFIGVVLALCVNMYHESRKDYKTYVNTLKSIQFEARGNTKIMTETFALTNLTERPVFRDLNTKIVENSLDNNTFVELADSQMIEDLVGYMNELKRLNAHRLGLEKLYFASDAKTPENQERRSHLISILTTNEVDKCMFATTNLMNKITHIMEARE